MSISMTFGSRQEQWSGSYGGVCFGKFSPSHCLARHKSHYESWSSPWVMIVVVEGGAISMKE